VTPVIPGISGAVLAGGRSRRMGQDKALLRLNGMTFLERSIRTVQPVVKRVVVAGGQDGRYALPGITTIGDPIPGCGPLGGILAALEESSADAVCILACDLPFVTTDLIRLLATTEPAVPLVVPMTGDDIQPLCARYAVSLRGPLRQYLLRGGRTVMDFIVMQRHACIPLGPDHPVYRPHLLANVNTDEDLRNAEAYLAQNLL
jgi:molybdopterin-guanine dinucleotide biosynthesis protein A